MFIFRKPLDAKLHLYASSRLALVAGMMSVLGGCGALSSGTIVSARTPVNEAVATTARQQTLMNIVRVYHNEAPVILDIVEADEAVSISGQAMGEVSGIGAAPGAMTGQVGSANGTLGAGDAVTNRYVPLQGQALISQLSSQITVETLNALYDSDWPLHSILELAANRLTPADTDIVYASDLLTFLDASNAIALATAKSGFSKPADPKPINARSGVGQITIQTQAPSNSGGDSLNIYLEPRSKLLSNFNQKKVKDAWANLYNLYRGTQPNEKGSILTNQKQIADFIELRNSPRTNLDKLDRGAFLHQFLGPIMRTRTAVGILKYLTSQPKVAFVTPAGYARIREAGWNGKPYFKNCPAADSYTIDPFDEESLQKGDDHLFFDPSYEISSPDKEVLRSYLIGIAKLNEEFAETADVSIQCVFSYVWHRKNSMISTDSLMTGLSQLKRLILIVKSSTPVSSSNISWHSNGEYFSIMSDDHISQRNLMLVSQFLTIQATSTPIPSLTTISASGR